MGKQGKGLYLHDVGHEIQMRIKLLAIAEHKHMYELVRELLTDGLEVYRQKRESKEIKDD